MFTLSDWRSRSGSCGFFHEWDLQHGRALPAVSVIHLTSIETFGMGGLLCHHSIVMIVFVRDILDVWQFLMEWLQSSEWDRLFQSTICSRLESLQQSGESHTYHREHWFISVCDDGWSESVRSFESAHFLPPEVYVRVSPHWVCSKRYVATQSHCHRWFSYKVRRTWTMSRVCNSRLPPRIFSTIALSFDCGCFQVWHRKGSVRRCSNGVSVWMFREVQ